MIPWTRVMPSGLMATSQGLLSVHYTVFPRLLIARYAWFNWNHCVSHVSLSTGKNRMQSESGIPINSFQRAPLLWHAPLSKAP